MKNDHGTGSELTPADYIMALLWLCAIFGACALCISIGIKALRWGFA